MSEFPVEAAGHAAEPIAFGARFTQSATFRDLFREGMSLVEETAAYLDGPGRDESRALPRGAMLSYTTESMRLTTRLMQVASWLLLQRAVTEGELSPEDAIAEKNKVSLDGSASLLLPSAVDELPSSLGDLISRSLRLQDRVRHLDDVIYGEAKSLPVNPVAIGLGRLAEAFGGPRNGF